MASIHETKSKTHPYRVRWREDGRNLSRSVRTMAEAKVLKAEAELGQVAVRKGPHLEFGEVFVAWLDARPSLKDSTRRNYMGMLNGGLDDLRYAPIHEISTPRLRQWVTDRLEDGAAPGTVNRRLKAIRSVMRFALAEGVITMDPSVGVSAPQGVSRSRHLDPPTQREVERLAKEVDALGWDGELIIFLAWTGLRLGEALALTGRDIDLQRSRVRVKGGKTDAAARTVPYPDRLAERMAEAAQLPRRRVFEDAGSQNTIRKTLAAACEAIGIDRLVPHDLRHTCASWLLDQGVPVPVVSRWLGHANASITLDTYGHMMGDGLESAAASLRGAA